MKSIYTKFYNQASVSITVKWIWNQELNCSPSGETCPNHSWKPETCSITLRNQKPAPITHGTRNLSNRILKPDICLNHIQKHAEISHSDLTRYVPHAIARYLPVSYKSYIYVKTKQKSHSKQRIHKLYMYMYLQHYFNSTEQNWSSEIWLAEIITEWSRMWKKHKQIKAFQHLYMYYLPLYCTWVYSILVVTNLQHHKYQLT